MIRRQPAAMNPETFTYETHEVFKAAERIALNWHHAKYDPVHVIAALLEDPNGRLVQALSRAKDGSGTSRGGRGDDGSANWRTLCDQALKERHQKRLPPAVAPPDAAVVKCVKIARKLQEKSGLCPHLLVDQLTFVLLENKQIRPYLKKAGLTVEQVKLALEKVTSSTGGKQYETLEKFGTDLVKGVARLDPVIGRDDEIGRVIRILSRRTKSNAILIGETGVGKTAVVEGVAQRIAKGEVPIDLVEIKLISLDMGLLMSGAGTNGEIAERFMFVLKEAEEAGNVILFIDEIHLLLGTRKSGQGSMEAANVMKPMLARGQLQCIGATTLDDYTEYVEKDAAFARRFQQVLVAEPTVAESINILRGLKDKYEIHHGVTILDTALVAAVDHSNRYITGRFLPDKAIDLMDEACANVRVQRESQPQEIDILRRRWIQLELDHRALQNEMDKSKKGALAGIKTELVEVTGNLEHFKSTHQKEKSTLDELQQLKQKHKEILDSIKDAERVQHPDFSTIFKLRNTDLRGVVTEMGTLEAEMQESTIVKQVVGPDQIAEIVSLSTGVPVTRLGLADRDRLLGLADRLHERIVGQHDAVKAVAEAVMRSRAGLSREEQPVGSFLLLGPTGVGKTELAKALAEQLFDDEKKLVRIDMSEYRERFTVSRLIGSPPGYVGYDDPAQLTEPIRTRPYSVILFDEIEKAHDAVLNLLLQVLDDGRLTDGKGRTVNFTNTVIIMTSNVGAEQVLVGGASSMEEAMQEARRKFRPELLNRLDEIVVFSPLSHDELRRITKIQMEQVAARLAKKGPHLSVTDAAYDIIMKESYDARYGARPIRRWIQTNVSTKLGNMLFNREVPPDDSFEVVMDGGSGNLSYSVRERKGKDKT